MLLLIESIELELRFDNQFIAYRIAKHSENLLLKAEVKTVFKCFDVSVVSRFSSGQ